MSAQPLEGFPRVPRPAIERVMDRLMLDANDCWLYDGSLNQNGYGRVNAGGGKYRGAHQITFEHFRGPVPDGLELDHLCRIPRCANPWHVEPVSHAENVRRGTAPNVVAAREGRCKRGHPRTPENVYRRKDGGSHCLACRREMRQAGLWT